MTPEELLKMIHLQDEQIRHTLTEGASLSPKAGIDKAIADCDKIKTSAKTETE
jgi:hypothetical protein